MSTCSHNDTRSTKHYCNPSVRPPVCLSTRSLKLGCRAIVAIEHKYEAECRNKTHQSAAEQGFMDIITSSGRNVVEAEKFVVSMSKIKRDRGIVTISIKSEHEVIGCLLLAVVAGIA